MVEVLAAALTGARLGFEASSFFDAAGAPPAVGHFLIAIDAGAFAGEAAFGERIAALTGAILGEGGTRLPGTRRIALRESARRTGVAVDARLARRVGAIGNADNRGS